MPKRLYALLAALAMNPAVAIAQDAPKEALSAPATTVSSAPVRMSDAELDEITAGFVAVLIFNPGPHLGQPRFNDKHFVCINCGGSSGGGVFGVVITPKGDTKIIGPR